MALQLMILPHMPRTGIQGHVQILLMRPNYMKQVPTIADGLNFKSFIAATQYLKIRASYAPMVPLPAMSTSQNMHGIL
jgi:hypothetical protein